MAAIASPSFAQQTVGTIQFIQTTPAPGAPTAGGIEYFDTSNAWRFADGRRR